MILALRLIFITAAIQGVGSLVAYGLIATRRMSTVLGAYAISAVFVLFFGPILIKNMKLTGAATTFLIGRSAELFMTIMLIYYRKKDLSHEM
jgi:O-antigen/teichoic acid export membrane protein